MFPECKNINSQIKYFISFKTKREYGFTWTRPMVESKYSCGVVLRIASTAPWITVLGPRILCERAIRPGRTCNKQKSLPNMSTHVVHWLSKTAKIKSHVGTCHELASSDGCSHPSSPFLVYMYVSHVLQTAQDTTYNKTCKSFCFKLVKEMYGMWYIYWKFTQTKLGVVKILPPGLNYQKYVSLTFDLKFILSQSLCSN